MIVKNVLRWTPFIFFLTSLFLSFSASSIAQESPPAVDGAVAEVIEEKGLDEKIDDLFAVPTAWIIKIVYWQIPLGEDASIPFILVWLVVGASIFTLYFKFVNIRCFPLALKVVSGKYSKSTEPGEVSHFQALTAALSGTVGLGNIAGVAVAISIGGPGATFWMILVGLLGMSSKFVECTLGVKYRSIDDKGRVFGGPMHYLKKGLANKGMGGLGSVLAVLFAVLCIGGSLGGGNMFQANQAYQQFTETTGLLPESGWVFGLVLAIVVALVIIGGIRSIAKVTSKIVPIMCGMYVIAALAVLITHVGDIPMAFGKIFSEAFAPISVAGGMLGVIIQGFKRAAFSNEAGIGSASIAHAAVKTKYPASEGIVALLEPFVDTILVCTMTALVIIITGEYTTDAAGVKMTSNAFASVISWFPYILSVAVVLFAFSTMITWAYYGQQAWAFLFGHSQPSLLIFKLIFCFSIIVGSASSLGNVLDFSDMMILGMCFPNIIGLYFLMGEVKTELKIFTDKIEDGSLDD